MNDRNADPSATDAFARRLARGRLTRRDTLWLFAASTAPVALQGCATSPVTGERILVGMSPEQEKAADARHSPHQFSQDLGAVQDEGVNRYVREVSSRLEGQVQRRDMPYSVRVLNANYVNAYTFPAGAMGITRGIMTEMKDESELAALLGHELGHVNARHAAQRQGQALLAQAAVIGLTVAVSTRDSSWAPLIGLGATVGASALLASYSRDNEREADALGQDYMARAGYPAEGMVALHQLLVDQEKARPGLLATMFSSHPMSAERRDTARQLAQTRFAASRSLSPQRERYMDNTASLRRLKPTIDACKNGELAMSRKALPEARAQFATAVQLAPGDYAANLRMAQCLHAMGQEREARRYAQAARTIYPQEAQAAKLAATIKLGLREPAEALQDLEAYDRLLPGDPGVVFLKGVAHEGTGNQRAAAAQFAAYLKTTQQGQAAQYSTARLKAWGYLK